MSKCSDCFHSQLEIVGIIKEMTHQRRRCHAHPPVMVDNGGDGNFFHPIVQDDDYCGEFRPKQQQGGAGQNNRPNK